MTLGTMFYGNNFLISLDVRMRKAHGGTFMVVEEGIVGADNGASAPCSAPGRARRRTICVRRRASAEVIPGFSSFTSPRLRGEVGFRTK